jgi:hypothetical protein
MWLATVIKLKQVEHVRNERKSLAAVVGHPFITTLVASFSDEQNLYMLVWARRFLPWFLQDANPSRSWTFALEARFSHTSDVRAGLTKKPRGSTRPKLP